jgi:hypothetical protein
MEYGPDHAVIVINDDGDEEPVHCDCEIGQDHR